MSETPDTLHIMMGDREIEFWLCKDDKLSIKYTDSRWSREDSWTDSITFEQLLEILSWKSEKRIQELANKKLSDLITRYKDDNKLLSEALNRAKKAKFDAEEERDAFKKVIEIVDNSWPKNTKAAKTARILSRGVNKPIK